MVVQWLRLHVFTAVGMALILLRELKSHMLCSMAKNLKKKKKKEEVKIHFFFKLVTWISMSQCHVLKDHPFLTEMKQSLSLFPPHPQFSPHSVSSPGSNQGDF